MGQFGPPCGEMKKNTGIFSANPFLVCFTTLLMVMAMGLGGKRESGEVRLCREGSWGSPDELRVNSGVNKKESGDSIFEIEIDFLLVCDFGF